MLVRFVDRVRGAGVHLMSPGKKGLLERSSSVQLLAIVGVLLFSRMHTVLLEMSLASSHQLDGSELVTISC